MTQPPPSSKPSPQESVNPSQKVKVTSKNIVNSKLTTEQKEAKDNQDLNEATEGKLKKLLNILQLETKIKNCRTIKALEFLLVNELRLIELNYVQAIVYTANYTNSKTLKATTASGVSHIDEQSSFIKWSNQVIQDLQLHESKKTTVITIEQLSQDLQEEWRENHIFKIIWIPLIIHDRPTKKFLWLSIEKTFTDNHLILLDKIASNFAYGFKFLEKKDNNSVWKLKIKQKWHLIIICVFAAICFIPIRLSALAPAEIIGKDSIIITSSIDGVIQDIYPKPNTKVTQWQTLIKIDDRKFRNELAIAEQNIALKLAEYKTALRGAFSSIESKSKLTFLKQEIALLKAEEDYYHSLLKQTVIIAPQEGVILFEDPQNLIGKPVQVGEALMELANPNTIELKVKVPLDDAIVLQQGYPIKFFLDSDPLNPIPGEINYSSYYAYPARASELAYTVIAELDLSQVANTPRIGLSGTCKIFGEKVSLAYYLFRKPIAFIRSKLGF